VDSDSLAESQDSHAMEMRASSLDHCLRPSFGAFYWGHVTPRLYLCFILFFLYFLVVFFFIYLTLMSDARGSISTVSLQTNKHGFGFRFELGSILAFELFDPLELNLGELRSRVSPKLF